MRDFKFIIIFLYIVFNFSLLLFPNIKNIEIDHNLSNYSSKKLKVLLSNVKILDKDISNNTNIILNILKNELNKTGHFDVFIKEFERPKNKKEILDLFSIGYNLVIFIELSSIDKKIWLDYRIYDSIDATMVKGRRIYKQSKTIEGFSYNITDEIIEKLTNYKWSASSKIAYLKKRRVNKNYKSSSYISTIYLCDYDGKNHKLLFEDRGIYVNLYWHNSENKPILFFSEFTKYNIKLVSIGLKRVKKNVFNLPGSCVGLSLSKYFDEAIYCRSGEIWHYKFNSDTKRSLHKKIISNDGTNSNPILLENNDIIFCSDSKELYKNSSGKEIKGRIPRIYYYSYSNGEIECLTLNSYCICPNYSRYLNSILYSKKIDRYNQLCELDLNSKKERQLTFDKANHIDGCFSPCGNFIVFCYQKDRISKIAIYNRISKSINFITDDKDFCFSPTWSNNFKVYPTLE